MLQEVKLIRLIDQNDKDYNKIKNYYNFGKDLYLESIEQLKNKITIAKYYNEYTLKETEYENISVDYIDNIKNLALYHFDNKKIKNNLNIINIDIFNEDIIFKKDEIIINMLDLSLKTNLNIKQVYSFEIRKIKDKYLFILNCQLINKRSYNYLSINILANNRTLIAFNNVALQPIICTYSTSYELILFINSLISKYKIDRIITSLNANEVAYEIYKQFSSKIIIVNTRNISKSNFFKNEKASIEYFKYEYLIKDIELNKTYQLMNKCDDKLFIDQTKYNDKSIYISI